MLKYLVAIPALRPACESDTNKVFEKFGRKKQYWMFASVDDVGGASMTVCGFRQGATGLIVLLQALQSLGWIAAGSRTLRVSPFPGLFLRGRVPDAQRSHAESPAF